MTINALDAVLLNWYSMTDVERSSPVEIDELVYASEDILCQEKSAWMSQKEDKSDDDKKEDKKKDK